FPVTTLAYDTSFGISGNNNKGSDCYVIKVNNSGSEVWGTYFGGDNDEVGNGIALVRKQSKQYVIISGVTKSTSSSFDLVAPIQNLLNGNDSSQYYDAFIAILSDVSTTQQQLVFSTYFGGSNDEAVKEVQYHPSIAV